MHPKQHNINPSTILLLSQKNFSFRTEIAVLRSLGVSSFLYQSDIEKAIATMKSASGLEAEHPDTISAVICDEQFAGHSVCHFFKLIADDSNLAMVPLLFIANSTKMAKSVEQCNIPVLCRPYTERQMANSLRSVFSSYKRVLDSKRLAEWCVRSPKKEKAIAPLPKKVTTISSQIHLATKYLQQGEYTKSEKIFLEVLQRQESNLEACIGLSRIYMQRKDEQGVAEYAVKAVAICERDEQYKKYSKTVRSILPDSLKKGSIYIHEAEMLLAKGEINLATFSLLEHFVAYPKTPPHTVIARICQKTDAPEAYVQKICDAFERTGNEALSKKIRHRLLMLPPVTISHEESWFSNYPLLQEIVSIASYTAWAWRQA